MLPTKHADTLKELQENYALLLSISAKGELGTLIPHASVAYTIWFDPSKEEKAKLITLIQHIEQKMQAGLEGVVAPYAVAACCKAIMILPHSDTVQNTFQLVNKAVVCANYPSSWFTHKTLRIILSALDSAGKVLALEASLKHTAPPARLPPKPAVLMLSRKPLSAMPVNGNTSRPLPVPPNKSTSKSRPLPLPPGTEVRINKTLNSRP